MHGKGLYHFADGCTYDGGYADGRRHGVGTFAQPGGSTEVGEWSRGALVRTLTPADGGGGMDGGGTSGGGAAAHVRTQQQQGLLSDLAHGAKRAARGAKSARPLRGSARGGGGAARDGGATSAEDAPPAAAQAAPARSVRHGHGMLHNGAAASFAGAAFYA